MNSVANAAMPGDHREHKVCSVCKIKKRHLRPRRMKMSIKVIAKKLTGKARKKLPESSFAIPASHPQNKGKKDKFPINDESHARNAISRANQFSTSPDWWSGSAQELVNTVTRAVKSKFPKIEISDKAKKKKANLSEILDLIVTAADELDNLGLTKESTILDNISRLLIATEPLKVQQPPPPSTNQAKPGTGDVNPPPIQQPETTDGKTPINVKDSKKTPSLTTKPGEAAKPVEGQTISTTPPAETPKV